MGYCSTRPMDADPQPERFYAGEFRHSIDEKNRITIPSRWRRDRPEDFILLPEATHQFLLVMSPKEFAKMSLAAETNEKVSARDRRVFLRQLHSRAQHAGADRQGRLVLPDELCRPDLLSWPLLCAVRYRSCKRCVSHLDALTS